MSLWTQSIGTIFDHYTEVIQGTDRTDATTVPSTQYKGIPGTRSHHDATGTTYQASEAGSNNGTTDMSSVNSSTATGVVGVIRYNDIDFADSGTVANYDVPQLFVRWTSGNNNGDARRIYSYTSSTGALTLFPALDTAIANTEQFEFVEGFKRIPDNLDIMDPNTTTLSGHDRMFQFTAMPGKRRPWYGNGNYVYETKLELRVRFLKHGRSITARQSAFENIMQIRTELTKPANRDSSTKYVQALQVEDTEPSIEAEDNNKIVVLDEYGLVYRVATDVA